MAKIYRLLIFLFACTPFLNAGAQTNIARTATMSTNVLGNTAYPISNMNDGIIVSCGSWTSNGTWFNVSNATSGEYIEWSWSAPKGISKMTIHYGETGNRFMNGFNLEAWTGSAWSTIATISNVNSAVCVHTFTFNTVTTTALRLTNMNIVGTQNTNPDFREIELFGPTFNEDAGVSLISNMTLCDLTQTITARISNMGKKTLDSFRLNWSVNGTNQGLMYISSRLGSGKDTVITLNSAFNFTRSTNYIFKAWTALPNGNFDSLSANDTFTKNLAFVGYPLSPSTVDKTQCGGGRALLEAIPASPSDSISWYDASTGGNFIGLGKKVLSPFIKGTTTFYAQVGGGARFKVDNGFTGGTIVSASTALYNGAYFNITPSRTIFLDSIMIRLYQNLPTGYRLYYKVGTHSGSETNSAAWTLLANERGRVFTNAGRFFMRGNAANVQLNSGQVYGFYFTTDPSLNGNDFYLTNGTNPRSNADVSFSGSVVVNSLFGTSGLYTTWMVDIELMYGYAPLSPCISNAPRTPVTITVKPTPIGAELTKGSTFQGQFNIGDYTKPDVAEVGKTISYDLSPPTGYNNADHSSTWILNGVTARTRYGTVVSPSDYSFTYPGSGGPAVISFTPTSTYLDSFITFSARFSDLGPHFCDSTVNRTLIVAPTPRPKFKLPASICLGDAVLFDNLTTIHSGTSTYMWYFGDGDSSDSPSPVHEYKQAGTYNVKLVAKSYPWNVLKDTTVVVEVGELPEVKFKVNNKCFGTALTFQNQTTVGNGALTYEWDFGDGTKSTASNPSKNYAAPGGYRVTLKASANGCVSTLTKNAYAFARPVPNFDVPSAPVCANSEIEFENTSTIALGSQGAYWRFGDGASSTEYDGEHAYTTAGTYNVKLMAVSEFDCRDSITKQVVIKPTPNPDFTGDQFCGKIPTQFTNTTVEDVPNPVYTWNFSDGFTSQQKNLSRTWPFEGPFSGTLKAEYSNGCSAEVTKNFTVLIQPKAGFTVKDICSGESANFVNQSTGDRGNIQYNWDFGNGTYSSLAAPVRLFTNATTTTYTVALVASYAGGCSDTVRKTLTVSETPVCDFDYKELGFLNTSFTPKNTAYSKYEWFFGEGGTSTQTSPVYKYLYSGNFNVTMKATNAAGCECSITKRIGATTSVNSISSGNGVSVYPNPNNGTFTVSNAAGNAMKVEVFNVLGEKILSKNTAEGSTVVSLDEHAKGIYLVKVTVNGVTSTTRITVAN